MSAKLWALVVACTWAWSVGCGQPSPSPATSTAAAAPAQECAVGTRPDVDGASCHPVGPSLSSPTAWIRDDSGWGYDAPRPDHACEDDTMAIVGQTECQPVDDCAAPFPPPGADIVLRPKSESLGPTPLQDAVDRVRASGTIALDEGEYDFARLRKGVHIVGRCAKKVRIRSHIPGKVKPPGGPYASKDGGIFVYAPGVTLTSMTIEGFEIGVFSETPGATLKLDRMILSGNRYAAAMVDDITFEMAHSVVRPSPDFPRSDATGPQFQYGAKGTLTEVDIRGMDTAVASMSPTTQVFIRRSYVSDPLVPVYHGAQIETYRGATTTIEDSFLSANAGFVMNTLKFLADPPSEETNDDAGHVIVKRSVLLYDGVRGKDANYHEGIMNLWEGAHVELEDTTVLNKGGVAIAVMSGSVLTARRCAIIGDSAVVPEQIAIGIHDGASRAELEDSVVANAQQVGIMLRDRRASLSLTRSLVTGTKHRETYDFDDIGGTGQAIAAAPETRVELTESALVANEGLGIYAGSGASVVLSQSLIDDTRASADGYFGIGAYLTQAQLTVDGSMVRRSADTALAFDEAMGIVTSSLVADSPHGIRAWGGTSTAQTEIAPSDLQANLVLLFGIRFERSPETTLGEAVGLPDTAETR